MLKFCEFLQHFKRYLSTCFKQSVYLPFVYSFGFSFYFQFLPWQFFHRFCVIYLGMYNDVFQVYLFLWRLIDWKYARQFIYYGISWLLKCLEFLQCFRRDPSTYFRQLCTCQFVHAGVFRFSLNFYFGDFPVDSFSFL